MTLPTASAATAPASAAVFRRPSAGFCVAVVGAESTGKTVLCASVADRLRQAGIDAVPVAEVLRAWCDAAGRTPRADEQAAIARAQAEAIGSARQRHAVVVADTTPLMTAVYSDLLFGDTALYPGALAFQQSCDATFVTGLDVPWVADGLQRDGPQVREPVDRRVREALAAAGVPFQVLYGGVETRAEQVVKQVTRQVQQTGLQPARLQPALPKQSFAIENIATCPGGAWAGGRFGTENTAAKWSCERCGDPACERRLFSRLLDR